MKRLMQKEWIEFQDSIFSMNDNSSANEILDTILTWLRRYAEVFLCKPFSDYGFDKFLSLKADLYPVDISPMHGVEFIHFKRIIKEYITKDSKFIPIRNAEGIARYLRDTLETLIVLETDKQCPTPLCESSYKDSQDGRIALECRTCGAARYLDGSKVSHRVLVFATIDDLRNSGLMNISSS